MLIKYAKAKFCTSTIWKILIIYEVSAFHSSHLSKILNDRETEQITAAKQNIKAMKTDL
jgi:hypothetical protein